LFLYFFFRYVNFCLLSSFFFSGSCSFLLLPAAGLAVGRRRRWWSPLLLVAAAVGFAAGGRRRCCTGRGSRGWSVVEVGGEGINEVRELLNLQWWQCCCGCCLDRCYWRPNGRGTCVVWLLGGGFGSVGAVRRFCFCVWGRNGPPIGLLGEGDRGRRGRLREGRNAERARWWGLGSAERDYWSMAGWRGKPKILQTKAEFSLVWLKGGELVRESQPDEGEGGWSPCKKIRGQGWGRDLVSAEYKKIKKLGLDFFVVVINFLLLKIVSC